MHMPTTADWSKLADTATHVRDRLASMDVGKVATRTVGGAVVLGSSFLVIANLHAPATPDPSTAVAARIAPVGTVQLAGPMSASALE
jgi:hypothetical protein